MHTPIPWTTEPNEGRTQYITGINKDGERISIAKLAGHLLIGPNEVKANTAFIVRAVNSHQALVEALTDARRWLVPYNEKVAARIEMFNTCKLVDAALKLAKA